MTADTKLIILKSIHTIIWIFYNVVIFYLFYSVWINQIDRWAWICISLILLEMLILVVFRRVCPITIIASRYSKSARYNFDIYLPNWLARYNQEIYSVILIIIFVIFLYRLWQNIG